MESYYQKHKQLWKTKYNKTEYCSTKGKRYRKFMIVFPLPNGKKLKFKSYHDLKKYCKKEEFNFDRDFQDLIQV